MTGTDMTEIERVFRCRVADLEAFRAVSEPSEIRQGYLNNDGPTIRVRERAGRWMLTIKAGSGMVRDEIEFDIPEPEGRALLRLAGSRTVEKTRHVAGRWEVDFYHGALNGLVTADCELSRPDEPLPPPPPGIELVREVTDDPRYTNHSFARSSEEARRRIVADG